MTNGNGTAIAPPRPGRARSLSCPNCGSPVHIRASGFTVTAACPACGAVLDVASPDVRLIAEAQARTETPVIPIGTRGTLGGTEWEVVGYQRRSSEAGSWPWEEYLLFNPYRGFRFLGQDHGHWTVYGMLRRDVPDPAADGGDGRRYRLAETVVARTDYVLGEFYWRVRVGDTVSVREFAHPPFVLTEERAADEVTWSRGRYLEPTLVQAAFKLHSVPPRTGRVAHQPEARRVALWPLAIVSLIALTVLNAYPSGQGLNALVLRQSFTITQADQDHTLPAVPLAIPDAGGNLQIEASADAGSGLLQLGMSLVTPNGYRRRETTFILGSLLGDGTETQTTLFGSVAGGAATLLIRPRSSAFDDPTMPGSTAAGPAAAAVSFVVTVRRHVHDPTNYLLAVLAILAWPIGLALWRWFRRIGHRHA